MSFRRALAVILCVAVTASALFGCKKDTDEPGPSGGAVRFDAAYEQYAPETAMFTAGGLTATWDVVYYFLCRAIEEIYETTGELPDLSDASETGYHEQIMTRAGESVLTCLAIEYAAQLSGAEITDDDRAMLALSRESAEQQEGGAKEFAAALWESHASLEVYLYLMGIDCLYENSFTATWGEDASLYPDDKVESFLGGEEYLMVKHILRSVYADDGVTPLPDDEKQAQLDFTETMLKNFTDYTGDDFDGFFDAQMKASSEDAAGVNLYPDGYLFKSGQAYAELEQAASDLEIGEFSGVVTTDMGYHIVYRLPVNYDVVPQGYSWDMRNTLRSQAAREDFGNYVEELRIKLSEDASGDFFSLELAELFG